MPGPRIADYLLDRGWVSRAQVDEARRTQVFFGGHIETHLLTLGYVSESVLGEALTEVCGVPFASWGHLRVVPGDAIDAVPRRLVERFRLCPLRLEGKRLRVAFLDPRDPQALREIQAATRLTIEPWVTTELRMYQALERHFQIRLRSTRAITMAAGTARARPERTEEREPAAPRPSGPAAEIGLDGRPLHEPARPLAGASPTARVAPTEADALDILGEALAAAADRDGIAEALLDYCTARARRVGLFAVSKEGIRGVAGRGRGFETGPLRSVVVPAGSGTIFDTALQSRDFYFGVVPTLPANRDLYTALGGRLPATALIVPIVVQDRTAALLYLDGDSDPLESPDIATMRRVAAKTSLAYELLLLRRKLLEL